MQADSLDLRERIVAALREGATLQQTADRFAVALSTVKRYKAQHQATGTVAPKPWPGRARKIKDEDRQALLALVAGRLTNRLDAGGTLSCLARAARRPYHGKRPV